MADSKADIRSRASMMSVFTAFRYSFLRAVEKTVDVVESAGVDGGGEGRKTDSDISACRCFSAACFIFAAAHFSRTEAAWRAWRRVQT